MEIRTMWSGTQIQSRPHLPTIRKYYSSPTHISASTRRAHSSSDDDQVKVGGLGLAVLTAYKSKPDAHPLTTTNQIQRRKSLRHLQEEEELVVDGGELSGSDVLLALQKAATKKKKKKKKRSNKGGTRLNESDDDHEESDVDSGTVKPLMIKSEWEKRIEDLERRLQELSEI